jgi:hypothetical protein
MTAVFRERGFHRSGSILGLGALLTAGALAISGCMHAPTAGGLIPHLGSKPAPASAPQAGIGVNSYLWRATLDTLAFMPLASADPFGGVVMTDWWVVPEKTDERLKATVYILDTRLRADGLSVTIFKQTKDAAGNWVDAPVAGQTDIDIENAILTRARQLRLSNLNDKG